MNITVALWHVHGCDEVEVPADVSETISRNPVGYGGVMESWTSSHMLRIESLWHVQLVKPANT